MGNAPPTGACRRPQRTSPRTTRLVSGIVVALLMVGVTGDLGALGSPSTAIAAEPAPTIASTPPTASTPAPLWPPFWPMAMTRAAAERVGLSCEEHAWDPALPALSCRSEYGDFEASVDHERERACYTSSDAIAPQFIPERARLLFTAVTKEVAGDPVLAAAWQEELWSAIAAGGDQAPVGEVDLAAGELPNFTSWSLSWSDSFGTPLELCVRLYGASTEPTPPPTAPVPTIAPSDVIDDAFVARLRKTCLKARPQRLRSLMGPENPPDRAPARKKVLKVETVVFGPQGTIEFPASLYDDATWGTVDEVRDLLASSRDEVGSLACVALRTDGFASYYSAGWTGRVYRYDTIVWMVDAQSGRRVARPWVYLDRAPFPQQIRGTVKAADLQLLPSRYDRSEVLGSIIDFMQGR